MRTHSLSLIVTGAILCSAGISLAEQSSPSWNSFRNGGASQATGDYPISWNPEKGILWEQELDGYGQSTPVIYGDQVFVSTVIGPMKDQCCLSSWDLMTGKMLWKHQLEAATKSASNYMHSRAAPTPVVDENGVFVFFEGGDLIGLSHDGKQQWHRNLASELGPFKNNHGLGSSPTQTSELVILTLEHQGPSFLIAIEKSSGEVRWKVERPSGNSWTSPIVVEMPKGPRVIVSSSGTVTTYDATSGQVIWTMEGLEGNSVPSPTAYNEHVLIGARLPEFGESSSAAKSNLCLHMTEGSYDVVWKADKVLSDYASPVVANDCAFYLNKSGVLTCLDLNTGDQHYKERLGCSCWATPLVAGDHIYFFGKNGETILVQASPVFEKVAVNQLWDSENPPKPETYVESEGHGHGHGAHGGSGHSQGAKHPGQKPDAEKESNQKTKGLLGMLMAGDANKDGVLIRKEIPEQFESMFARVDSNQDGQLDQAELKAMDESFKKRREGSREGACDPIVYGVAAADGVIVIRTGTRLYAVSAHESPVPQVSSKETQQ